jgi:hypothetical protein
VGEKKKLIQDSRICTELEKLLEPNTRGEPFSLIGSTKTKTGLKVKAKYSYEKRVFTFADQGKYSKSKAVNKFLENLKIILIYILPYSPKTCSEN